MPKQNFGLTTFQYNILYPICLMVIGVLMVASIDIYLPAAPYLKNLFLTNEWMIQLSMMQTPIVGSVIGLFYGHWSDIKGRRPAMISSLGIFAIGSFLCCFAWSIETFLACRFFQAIGAGGISVVSISVLSDLFKGATYARYMASFSMSFPIMFAIAPVIGAYLFEWFGWQANFWFLGLLASCLWLILLVKMPETNLKHVDSMSWGHILENFKVLTKTKNFMRYATCHGLPVAIAAVYAANSAFIFIDGFNFLPTSFAYIQLIPVLMNLLGSFLYRHLILKWGMNKCVKYAVNLDIGFLILTILGAKFQLLQYPFAIVFVMCILNLSLSSIIASCGTKAVECASDKRGLAVAFLGLFRSGAVAAFVLIIGLFFNGTIIPVYIGMAILTAVLIYLLWPLSRASSSID